MVYHVRISLLSLTSFYIYNKYHQQNWFNFYYTRYCLTTIIVQHIMKTSPRDHYGVPFHLWNDYECPITTVAHSSLTVTEVQFLGFDVSGKGVSSCKKGIEKVHQKNKPSGVEDIQSFLGMANFFCNQIPGLSEYASKLTKLTRKNAEWVWSDKQQEALDEIKRLISQKIETSHPDGKLLFHIVAYVSNDAFTAAIFQEKGRDVFPTHFIGGTWKKHEIGMSLIEKELEAFCRTLKKQYSVLVGNQIIIHLHYTYAEIFSQALYLSDRALKCTSFLSMYSVKQESMTTRARKVYQFLDVLLVALISRNARK